MHPVTAGTVTCATTGLAAGAIDVRDQGEGRPGRRSSTPPRSPPRQQPTRTPPTTAGYGENTIAPGTIFSDVATGDPDWTNHIDGVDVLFQKSGSSTYKLKATNPGTFRYRLSLENETGIDIHVKGQQLPNIIRRGVSLKDPNGARRRSPDRPVDAHLHRHAEPADRGAEAEPAFVLDGYKPVKGAPGRPDR